MNKLTARVIQIFGVTVLCGAMSGCIPNPGMAFGAGAGIVKARGTGNDFKYYLFDVPPQVIYRIDEHRFFTLENYRDCGHGGLAYYNDTKNNIKKYLNGGSDSNSLLRPNPLMSWKGELIYAASDDVIAYISRRWMSSDRDQRSGVFLTFRISGEYGKVLVATDSHPGTDITIVVMDNHVHLKTEGIPRSYVYSIPAKSEREVNNYNGAIARYGLVEDADWPRVQTPSGDRRFTCDYTIKPTKVTVTPEQVYAADATEVPKREK